MREMKTATNQVRVEKRIVAESKLKSRPVGPLKPMHIAKSSSVTVFRLPPLSRASPSISPTANRNLQVPKPPSPKPVKPAIDQYRLLRTIGTGTFSRVRLAVHKATHEIVVVKIMNKQDIVRKRQVEHVRNERNVLGGLVHPLIVNLKAAFQDHDHLYLVQEYVAGGELYRLLRNKGRFSLREAKFYAAEVMVAITFVHRQRIVYRDLKPENLLISQIGHVKLTDFGFAKQLNPAERTYTLCGTPEYLAPEVIQQRGHDYPCDWWGVGILLYEMITGHAPYTDLNPFKLYEKIVNTPLTFPADFDEVAKSLVRRLLDKVPGNRMGQTQAFEHEFFRGVDWGVVEGEGMVPPFIPSIRGPDDTSNFDQYPESTDPPDSVPVAYDLFPSF